MPRFLTTLAAVPFLVLCLAAGPTTKPAPPKKPIPSNWIKMTNASNHFEYDVPPTWLYGAHSDVETMFQIPVNPQQGDIGLFVVAARLTDNATLEDDVAEERKNLTGNRPGATITKEGKVDFNGKPAWRFEVTDVVNTPIMGPNGAQVGAIKRTFRRLEMVVHEGHSHYIVLYQELASSYNRFLPQAQQVFDSFKWEDPNSK